MPLELERFTKKIQDWNANPGFAYFEISDSKSSLPTPLF